MKGLILWVAFGVFLYLAITAWNMGEYTIMLVMGGIALACAVAAPSGGDKKSKRKAKSRR